MELTATDLDVTITCSVEARVKKAGASTVPVKKLFGIIREKGLALVPTKLYLKNGKIKCEIAVARGKKLHDKRETERAREQNEEARQAVRRSKADWD